MEVKLWIEKLLKEELLSEKQLFMLCYKVKEVLIEENNVQPVDAPVIIIGDIHGQFYDLLKLFEIAGNLPDKKYVFLGDYVDRGNHSVEVMSLLLCYKLAYPNNIWLIRGNHESRLTSSMYGFTREINKKYGNQNPWKLFTDVFDYMPLGVVISEKIFCVHGGLSPEASSIDKIRLINRNGEVPQKGLMADLMWSDPEPCVNTWQASQRGAGWMFGSKVVDQFNYINNLTLICRAHQIAMEGFNYPFRENKGLVTVWSAPNYCYIQKNKASYLTITPDLEQHFEIFSEDERSKSSNGNSSQLFPYFM